jgi:hypothetical protein
MDVPTYHLLLLIETLVDECSYNAQLREALREDSSAFGRGNQVEEKDALLGNAPAEEYVDCHEGRTACEVSEPCDHPSVLRFNIPVASMGSNSSTHLFAMSSGSLS